MRSARSPQDIDLDCLGLHETRPADVALFDDEPTVLRLQNEAILSDEGGLSDDVVDALLSLEETDPQARVSLPGRIASDHCNYYSAESALIIGTGLAGASLMAHTPFDEEVHRHVYESTWHNGGMEWAEPLHGTKILGNGTITLPVFAGLWLTSEYFDEVPILDVAGEWGERSLRTFLVGAPPMLAVQYATGASRPGESPSGSAWQPFQDSNGASGHAFMGAIPLLTAAKMAHSWPAKISFFALSILPGLSRVTDDDHYVSQALLGWTMAYAAATAVDRSQSPDKHLSILPLVTGNEVGAAMEYRW